MSDSAYDTGTHPAFYRYYEHESGGEAARERFRSIKRTLERVLRCDGARLSVADVGCGAGTQSCIWAADGHEVHGADINEALIGLARERAGAAGLAVAFEVASATALPWQDACMDVCIAPELLEHVEDWEGCIAELVRVLRPGGALYISTSNRLCPRQEEFVLPGYSWYPVWIKRRVLALARGSWPELAGYATYPAVHWFTFYQLRDHLAAKGLQSQDRFDLIDPAARGRLARLAVGLVKRHAWLRWVGHVLTPYTVILAVKPAAASP